MHTLCWQPTAIENTTMQQFIAFINQQTHQAITTYAELYQWSIDDNSAFWQQLLTWFNWNCTNSDTTCVKGQHMCDTRWFPGLTFNFAQELLKNPSEQLAIIACSENANQSTQYLTRAQLQAHVHALQQHLINLGVQSGDTVAGILPNGPEAIIAMLACSSIGAVWAAASPDFGLAALEARLSQVQPTLLFACQEYNYNGKTHYLKNTLEKLAQCLPSIQHTIMTDIRIKPSDLLFADCLTLLNPDQPMQFHLHPFDHPLYILFSSGTTGKPKCMVHGAGNTLLQHQKELALHTNLKPEERLFFYTTCGWMMWHWMVSALSLHVTLVLYDGCPFFPTPNHFLTLISQHQINVFGAGAQYYDSLCEHLSSQPHGDSLSACRLLLSTGSPLLPSTFDKIQTHIKSAIQISSISGGSDIISCFALGNPLLPVYRGEIQCLGLGMQVDVVDANNQPVLNQTGELTCANACPSMPIYFLNDPQGDKYHQAYFKPDQYRWYHSDYAKRTTQGGLIIYGRSDATLNPGGVRIGTAEIYASCDSLDMIQDCLATGYQTNNHERIVLFVVLKNKKLDEKLKKIIKQHIKQSLSPKHVPTYIIAAPDIPKTMNGKICEVTVKKIINHLPIDNQDALINPASLDFFKNLTIND